MFFDNRMMKQLFGIILFSLLAQMAFSQDLPQPPDPPRLVNDFAGVLDAASVSQLEGQLSAFARETSTQIAVVTIQDLGGYDAGDYAFRLAESWGIGQKGKSNGILVLVQPKVGNQRGNAFVATGYGLEGAVPDAVANRIVNNEMIPRFKQNDYAGGIGAAASVLMELTRGEYTADGYLKRTQKPGGLFGGFGVLIIIFVIVMVMARGQKTRHSSLGRDLPFWVLLSMLGSGSGRHTGQWDSFSSGSGSFGGGGGFGGFGGGGFGGGGAGGSW